MRIRNAFAGKNDIALSAVAIIFSVDITQMLYVRNVLLKQSLLKEILFWI